MPDLREELDECLGILAANLNNLTLADVDEADYEPVTLTEVTTAHWQTIELVGLLSDEHDAAWDAIQGLRVLIMELQTQLKQRDEQIWTPGQGGSSGQSRSPRGRRH